MGRTMLGLCSRQAAGLIGAVLVAVVWLSNPASLREEAVVRIVGGEPEVQTTSLACSPARKAIATTDTDGRVVLRDVSYGWTSERLLPFAGCARTVAFSPDGRFLVAGGHERGVIRFDLERDGAAQALPVPIAGVMALAFSPDGQTLAATTNLDATVILWDLAKGRERMVLRDQSRGQRIAFSPDGRHLASAGKEEPSIILWDIQTGSPGLRLKVPRGPVSAVAFSPDGAFLAMVCDFGYDVRLWDLRSNGSCRRIGGHRFGTTSVAFAPGGTSLATVGCDGMVRLWSVATGEAEAHFDGRASRLNAVAFSPDGETLVATGSNDSSIRLCELAQLVRDQTDSSQQVIPTRSSSPIGRIVATSSIQAARTLVAGDEATRTRAAH
jgi:WD40 repeat protein